MRYLPSLTFALGPWLTLAVGVSVGLAAGYLIGISQQQNINTAELEQQVIPETSQSAASLPTPSAQAKGNAAIVSSPDTTDRSVAANTSDRPATVQASEHNQTPSTTWQNTGSAVVGTASTLPTIDEQFAFEDPMLLEIQALAQLRLDGVIDPALLDHLSIAGIESPDLREHIESLLSQSDGSIETAMLIRALGGATATVHSAGTLDTIYQYSYHQDPALRQAAIYSLSSLVEITDTALRQSLETSLTDPSPLVRQEALMAIQRYPDLANANMQSVYKIMLDHEQDPDTRIQAYYALGSADMNAETFQAFKNFKEWMEVNAIY